MINLSSVIHTLTFIAQLSVTDTVTLGVGLVKSK